MRLSILLAAGIAVAAAGWILSGQFGLMPSEDGGPPPDARSVAERLGDSRAGRSLTAVRVLPSVAREHQREVVAQGRTEALRRVTVKAELVGKIARLNVRRGERVKRGEVLAQIELKDRQAGLDEARALVRQRELEYEAAERLREKGYRAATEHAAAAALLDAARAQVHRMEIEIALTAIRAPFDGVIDTLPVELGDYVDPGTAVAVVVDEDPFLVVAHVSEGEVGRLTLDGPGYARLVTGEEVAGKIRYIATTADAQTRTFRVELQVDNAERRLRDGVTAALHLPTDRVLAHRLSPAVLTLDDTGTIGVRCVNADGLVEFFPVQIIDSEATGVWIAGLPTSVDVIVVGQEFVREGEKVRPSRVDRALAES